MRTLATAPTFSYAAVIAMDNALPHLDSDDDYESFLKHRPSCMPPRFYSDDGRRRIMFQVWDWTDDRCYRVHLYVTRDTSRGWTTHHFEGSYRAVTIEEIAHPAKHAGLREVSVLNPHDRGFYQPIILAATGKGESAYMCRVNMLNRPETVLGQTENSGKYRRM